MKRAGWGTLGNITEASHSLSGGHEYFKTIKHRINLATSGPSKKSCLMNRVVVPSRLRLRGAQRHNCGL